MPSRCLYIAAYDVTEPSRLRQALSIAKEFATGGQKSVFECYLTTAERSELIARMRATLDGSEDRFALVRVQPRACPWTLGIAVPPADPDYFYVG